MMISREYIKAMKESPFDIRKAAEYLLFVLHPLYCDLAKAEKDLFSVSEQLFIENAKTYSKSFEKMKRERTDEAYEVVDRIMQQSTTDNEFCNDVYKAYNYHERILELRIKVLDECAKNGLSNKAKMLNKEALETCGLFDVLKDKILDAVEYSKNVDQSHEKVILEKKTKAFSDEVEKYKSEAYEEYQRIEADYQKYAMEVNIFVDYSRYATDWYKLNKKVKEELKDVESQIAYRKQQGVSDNDVLVSLQMLYKLLELYSMQMSGITSHLDMKAHGGDYSLDEYMNELNLAEKTKKDFEDMHKMLLPILINKTQI